MYYLIYLVPCQNTLKDLDSSCKKELHFTAKLHKAVLLICSNFGRINYRLVVEQIIFIKQRKNPNDNIGATDRVMFSSVCRWDEDENFFGTRGEEFA